jgi:two-component system, cell cycle sensor histidine kinase and response regulator CckA
MSSPTRHPRARLVRLIALLFLPLGLVATAVLITLPRRMNDLALSSAEERARGLAEVMASLVGPDLEFDDHEHASEALARLSVEPDLLSAELFGRDGNLFARWPSSAGQSSPPEALPFTRVDVDDDRIEVVSSVRAPGGTSGVLRLRFATSAIDDKRRANMTAAGLAAAVVVLVGLFFSVVTARFLVRRQAAEEALRRSGESYAALSDALPVALILHRDDRILYINPAGVKLLVGDETRSLVGASLSAQLAAGENLPAANGSARVHLDPRTLTLAGGKVLSVEATSLAVQFGESDAGALVAFDVTERTRMQERLLLSDRMASLGTLAAGVAHEINNPLAVVIGNVDYVREALTHRPSPPGDDTEPALSEALDAAHRVGRIVRDMKTLSRSDSDALAATDLNQVLDKSLQMVQGHLKHRAQIVRNLGSIPPVLGNESRLVQVFVNLLINAAQALPEGKAQENRIEVATAVAADGGVVATVRDTGCGIPAAMRDRIFDPFFTTKPVGVGTGLGLAIVHNLVQAMNGRIELSSIEDVGTTFTIHLRATVAAPRARGDSGAVPIGGRGRVLVIDDEPSVVAAVARLLADSHTVTGVQSARTALERFGRGESFDLILCDLRMPDMSGLELARHLDERYPHLRQRLVFMTGDIGEAGMSGASDTRLDPASIAPVLEKPFSRRDLLQFVDKHLHRRGPDGAPKA